MKGCYDLKFSIYSVITDSLELTKYSVISTDNIYEIIKSDGGMYILLWYHLLYLSYDQIYKKKT